MQLCWSEHVLSNGPHVFFQVSLGDEIGVSGAGTDVGFVAFVQSKGQTPADIGCTKPSWAAVLAACNTTTGECPECGAGDNLHLLVDSDMTPTD
jgi:hypothetical protein